MRAVDADGHECKYYRVIKNIIESIALPPGIRI
jgi:hypothetical protein